MRFLQRKSDDDAASQPSYMELSSHCSTEVAQRRRRQYNYSYTSLLRSNDRKNFFAVIVTVHAANCSLIQVRNFFVRRRTGNPAATAAAAAFFFLTAGTVFFYSSSSSSMIYRDIMPN